MRDTIAGRVYRLINRLEDGTIRCKAEPISVMRWSDSKIIHGQYVGVYELEDVVVTTAFTVISPKTNELYLDTTYDYADQFFKLPYKINSSLFTYHPWRSIKKINGPAILIGGSPEDGNWFHWNLNWAPRLSILKKLRPDLLRDRKIPIILHKHVSRLPYVHYLKSFDIEPERCIFLDNNDEVACEYLYCPSFISQMLYAKQYIDDLCERLINMVNLQYGELHNHPFRKIFVSRQNFAAPARRISNYDKIEPLLGLHNVETFIAEKQSLDKQINTFRRADVIVGVHGAGLINMIFTRKAADIVILDTQKNIEEGQTGMFRALAEMQGHRSYVVPCKEIHDTPINLQAVHPHRKDVIVDETILAEVLDRIAYSRNSQS